jgi:hypothetical protein
MSEAKGSGSEFGINPPDLSGKKDLISRFARGIQRVFGISPAAEVKKPIISSEEPLKAMSLPTNTRPEVALNENSSKNTITGPANIERDFIINGAKFP